MHYAVQCADSKLKQEKTEHVVAVLASFIYYKRITKKFASKDKVQKTGDFRKFAPSLVLP